MNVITIA